MIISEPITPLQDQQAAQTISQVSIILARCVQTTPANHPESFQSPALSDALAVPAIPSSNSVHLPSESFEREFTKHSVTTRNVIKIFFTYFSLSELILLTYVYFLPIVFLRKIFLLTFSQRREYGDC
jgi:hypothetical protein